jgi:hypothetical protein
VSCPTAKFCVAVGYYLNNSLGRNQTLIESWNGKRWTIMKSPNTSTSDDNYLDEVSCVSSSSCTAVGSYYGASNGYRQTLIESWDGRRWTIVSSPNASTSAENILYGVSCVSSSSCTAVGYYGASYYDRQTLIETWDGTSWAIVPSPNSSSSDSNLLYGVSCLSSNSCTAVGYYYGPSTGGWEQTLIESWDGTSWTIVPSLNSDSFNELGGVSCLSSSACTAVGHYSGYNQVSDQTLIESWDGTSWTTASSPNTSNSNNNTSTRCRVCRAAPAPPSATTRTPATSTRP